MNSRERIERLFKFIDDIERDLFDYEKVKDFSVEDKLLFYKYAKDSLKLYFDIMVRFEEFRNDDEMLKNIILNLTAEQKVLLKRNLVEILRSSGGSKV